MTPKIALWKKRKLICQLIKIAAMFLMGMSAACAEPASFVPPPAADPTQTANPTAVPTQTIAIASATTVSAATPIPTEPATATPVPTPTAVLTLPTIIQPLRSHQMIWFVQNDKLWRSDIHGVALDQLGSDDFLGWGEADGFGLASLRLSPDGRWLANPAHQDNKLHILDIGTREERILPVSVTALAWSPDSRTLAYTPARTFPASPKPDCTLCLYDLASDTHTSLIPNSDPAFESISNLVWSADGSKLAYGCCFVPREPYAGISDGRIETIHVAAGQRSEAGPLIASVGGGVEQFCWRDERIVTTDTALGDRCAATPTDWFNRISRDNLLADWEAVPSSNEWTATRLYVTNRVTGEVAWERTLETTKALRLGWSPDGRYLFFDDGSTDSPIWRLSADNSELHPISPDGILLGVVNRWESFQPPQAVSPNGRWQAISQIDQPVVVPEAELEQFPTGQKYRTTLTVRAVDGSQTWTAVDEWRTYGLGYTQPEPISWSADGRYLYYANIPNPDGCAVLVNGGDLWQLDLTNGTITEVAPYIGLVMALSPDETKLAVDASYGRGFLIRDLASGTELSVPLPQPAESWQIGSLEWSPDGRHLLIIQVLNACNGQEQQTALVRVDLAEETGEATAVTILEPDTRNFKLVQWIRPDEVRLQDAAGNIWYMDVLSGTMAQGQ